MLSTWDLGGARRWSCLVFAVVVLASWWGPSGMNFESEVAFVSVRVASARARSHRAATK